MVNAILEGRKTQTRRVVKPEPQPLEFATHHTPLDTAIASLKKQVSKGLEELHIKGAGKGLVFPFCPYQVGNVLWVREMWAEFPIESYIYKSTEKKEIAEHVKWKPSIHMPKKACRIFLEITEVRLQRLQDISANDAIDEGIEIVPSDMPVTYKNYENGFEWDGLGDSTQSFQSLWQSINGTDSWYKNPFVWAITYKRIDKPANWPC
jgi:hypothetical protein